MTSAYELFLIDHGIDCLEREADAARLRSQKAQLIALSHLFGPVSTPAEDSPHQTPGFAELLSAVVGISAALNADAQAQKFEELRDRMVEHRLSRTRTSNPTPNSP